jgi:hypothetical protein
MSEFLKALSMILWCIYVTVTMVGLMFTEVEALADALIIGFTYVIVLALPMIIMGD